MKRSGDVAAESERMLESSDMFPSKEQKILTCHCAAGTTERPQSGPAVTDQEGNPHSMRCHGALILSSLHSHWKDPGFHSVNVLFLV
eukprot:1138884-Pelagomonas_calceolata.AAC.1